MYLQSLYRGLIVLLAIIFVNCPVLNSQTVGLVLSGGGAKGLAHIGMIKALEENNIPIDYIAGTSMGAIVGGLYAIGYSPDEIEDLLKSDDFLRWSEGIIDIEETYYYKTKNETPNWLELPFSNVNGAFKPFLPTNLISPEQMDLRFIQFFEPAGAGANYDFNRLMVPFFCIASDVHKNQQVVLTHGNLSAAVRASMTFPGYFKPISIDSVLLFDGGMLNNFPADLMVEKYNPDILIGSKVVSNPKKPDSDDIYRQLENVFMKTTNYQVPKNGILIEPKVDSFGLFELNRFDTIYQMGYQAAMEVMDSIKKRITRRILPMELEKKREIFKLGNKPLIIQNIYITGVDNQTAEYILKNIQRNRQFLTFTEFEQEYFKLISDKIIRSVYPRAQFNSVTGYFDMYLEIKTKNEFAIGIGGNISSNLRNTGYLDLNYYFQKKNVYNLYTNLFFGNFYNSILCKFRIDFPPRAIKDDRVISSFYFDIAASANNWNYFKLSNEWYIDSKSPSLVIRKEYHFESNFGRPVATRGLIYTGFSYGRLDDDYFQTNLVSKDDIADRTTFDYSSIHATYEYSTLNYKEYATKGKFFKIQTRYITGQEFYQPGTTPEPQYQIEQQAGHSWFSVTADYQTYPAINRWLTLGFKSAITFSNKSAFSNSMSTLLRAFEYTPFPQSKIDILQNFRANTYLAAGMGPVFKVAKSIDIRLEAYIFEPYKYILLDEFRCTYSKTFPEPSILGSSALVWHTPIGPLSATASYFMQQESPFYFQLNFGYMLFNKRGID